MINITFLFILLFLASGVFLLKHLIKPNLKGFRGRAYTLLVLGLLTLLVRVISTKQGLDIIPHFLFLEIPFLFLVGPTFGFLQQSGRSKSHKQGLKSHMHKVPSVISFLLLIPFYIQPASSKLIMLASPPWWLSLIHWILVFHMVFYTWLSFKSNRRLPKGATHIPVGMTMTSVLWSFGLATGSVDWWILATGVMLLVVTLHWRSMVLQVNSEFKVKESSLRQQLENAMEEEKLYLQQDLSLVKLATHLNSSTNKVSYLLNQELGTGFNDWLNAYRVNEVIMLLQKDTAQRYTLEAVSSMAGFRSLTTFNKVFKKHTGKTPRQFNN